MNVLNLEHISKTYGEKVIFDDISCGIHQGDKIGIIGINGTGKTTFLRILAGFEETDEGQVVMQNGLRITYLPQHPEFPEGATILSYVIQGQKEQSWNSETEAHMVLNKLGIEDHEEEIAHLSGGQKKRVALAAVLVNPADVLILDEPTNHLDNEMASWLEDYLNRFKGVVIMVTHDRYFLDRVTNKILEISHGKIYTYEAKYSDFLEMKAQREEMEMASERKKQSILRMEVEWAKRGCRARSTKQRARLDRLEAMKNSAAPVRDKNVEIDSVETRMGKKTIELHHISKRFGERVCIRDFDYIVLKNQRLGIIGPNGCGKSTLLKIIAGILEPDSGSVEIGDTIKIGYFSQEIEDMNSSQRVIDYIKAVAEFIPTKDGLISASKLLEQFLFEPAMQYSPIEKLSGGEKKRLYLLKVLAAAPNVLLLDEITNDIDIPTLTILEDYLDSFAGIVIAVSHDRYFLDNLADRIFEFDREGNLTQYEGGYTDYLEAKKRREGMNIDESVEIKASSVGKNMIEEPQEEKSSVKTWKQNRSSKLKFSYKERKKQSILRMEVEWAKRGCRARSTKQRARLDRLEAMKNSAAPVRDKNVEIDSVETRMGKKTIELHHISKRFGERVCIRDFDYIVLKNQRLGIIGPNGCGKSTLLKIIAGILEPDSGSVEIGDTIKIGYFSQEIEDMNSSQRVIDYIKAVAEFIPTKDGLISASKLLEQFLFEPAMQYSPIEKLSGGEKKRLYLLKVLAAAPNVLLLDEITNDIDIPTLTILEDYLDSFAGIVIAVSHDRYFLDNLADRIFEFDREGNLTQYEGGYTDYLEAKKRREGMNIDESVEIKASSVGKNMIEEPQEEKSSVKTWKQNRSSKLKFSYKEQREYETIDDDIAGLEEKIEKLDNDIMANATNSGKLNELTKEKETAEALLEEKMDRWVYLNDLAEQIEAQNNK